MNHRQKYMEKLSVRPLSAELAAKAKTELNENPEKIFAELEALRSWISEQPHIKTRKGTHLITLLTSVYNLQISILRRSIFDSIPTKMQILSRARKSCCWHVLYDSCDVTGSVSVQRRHSKTARNLGTWVNSLETLQEIRIDKLNNNSNSLIKPLPTVDDKTGARILLVKPVAYNPRKITVSEFIKVTILALFSWQF